MLSIIIPVRNEADNLEISLIIFLIIEKLKLWNLIVNDFSRDITLTNAKVLCEKSKNFKVLDNKKEGLGEQCWNPRVIGKIYYNHDGRSFWQYIWSFDLC